MLRKTENGLLWWCPGCDCVHGVNITGEDLPQWTWNGNIDKPTIQPSALTRGQHSCHCFITDGKIQFLQDCTHHLAGQRVEIPEWPFKD